MAVARRRGISFEETHQFLSTLFSEDVHAKRVYSLANATLGVISSAYLAVNTIGQGLALARGRLTKHAIKQVDRLLSNSGIDVDDLLKRWVPHVVDGGGIVGHWSGGVVLLHGGAKSGQWVG